MHRITDILILFLVVALLNGALFNRMGSRLASYSYLKTLLTYITSEGEKTGKIEISKRVIPSQTSTAFASSLLMAEEYRCDDAKQNHVLEPNVNLTVKLLFAKYKEQLSEAHKPAVFKPPL